MGVRPNIRHCFLIEACLSANPVTEIMNTSNESNVDGKTLSLQIELKHKVEIAVCIVVLVRFLIRKQLYQIKI